MNPQYRRRRLTAGAGIAIALGVAAAVVSGNNSNVGLTPRPPTVAGPVQTTPEVDPRPPLVGDLVMTTMRGTTASPNLLRRARLGRIAGVLLMGTNITSPDQVRRLTASLQSAAYAGGNPPLIIAVDQEGGATRRLTTFPPRQSARQLGALTPQEIRSEGRATGRALRSVGINVDLAPVADVSSGPRSVVNARSFGGGAKRASVGACAFAEGLVDVGVAATLKHFPGLGGSTKNTDDEVVSIPFGVERLKRDLVVYRRCGGLPHSLTMVSNAKYPKLSGTTPAVLSSSVYGLAREMGVTGPIITDSLNARSLVGQPNIATRAVRAGANLLLFTSEGSSVAGYRELLRSTARGKIDDTMLSRRVARVRAFRRDLWTGG